MVVVVFVNFGLVLVSLLLCMNSVLLCGLGFTVMFVFMCCSDIGFDSFGFGFILFCRVVALVLVCCSCLFVFSTVCVLLLAVVP